MLGLTKTRRQADMRKSGPSGKRLARFFAAHRYRKSGPRKTALTGLRKKKNDCRYIDDTGACITPEARGGGLPPFKGIGRRSWKGHGESKEEARKGQGKSTEKTRREQGRARKGHGKGKEEARREHGKSTERARKGHKRPGEGQKKAKSASKEPAGGGKNRLEGGGKRTGWRGGKCRLRCMNTKKPAPSSGAGTLLGRSQIRASRHCQPSHARGWRTHA